MLTKQEKSVLVENLTNEFQNSDAVVVADYKGITHIELEAIRKESATANVKIQVIKNSLAMIAMDKAGKSGLELTGNSIFFWSDDLVTLAKSTTKFAKDNEKIVIKAGHFEGEVVDASKIDAYSKLASKEEFLGMLLSVWSAPIRNTLYVWSGVQRELVTVLGAIKDKKDEVA